MPTIASWRFPLRTILFVLCGCVTAGGLQAAAAKPDYYAARTFARELQEDFNQRNCAALIDRLDREAMRMRVFRPLGEEIANGEEAKQAWTSSLLPVVEDELQSLDHMSTLIVGRIVLLAEGDRALECIFLNDDDQFRLLTLRLHEAPDGRVGISDIQFFGAGLESSRGFRQILLLTGVKSHDLLPDDELALQLMAERDRSSIRETMAALGAGKAEQAYQAWGQVAEELQKSPIGMDMRLLFAAKGSKKALEALHQEWRTDPASNPMGAYNLALASHDVPQALAALDLLLQETQQLAFLRSMKAGILLKNGRAEEALRLSRDVCELTPINGISYMIGVRAAAQLQRPQVALELLQQWGHISDTASINRVLKMDVAPGSGMEAFLKSAAYQGWLGEAAKPITKPAG